MIKIQNEGENRENFILPVLEKAEFIMLGDLEMSLGRDLGFYF